MPQFLEQSGVSDQILVLVFAGIIFLGFVLIGYWLFFLRKPKVPAWKFKIERKWRELQMKDLEPKYAIIEYDKLLENIFQLRSNHKKSLGEALKSSKKLYTKAELDDIWRAHKLRNKLIHDHEYLENPSEMNRALITFKRAINDLLAN